MRGWKTTPHPASRENLITYCKLYRFRMINNPKLLSLFVRPGFSIYFTGRNRQKQILFQEVIRQATIVQETICEVVYT